MFATSGGVITAPGTLALPDGGSGGRQRGLEGHGTLLIEVFLVCTASRPIFLADRPISHFIEDHLARPNTNTSQNEPFILYFRHLSLRRSYSAPSSPAPKSDFSNTEFYIYGDVDYRGTQPGTSNRLLFSNHARFRRERATFIPSIWVLTAVRVGSGTGLRF